MRSIKSIEIAEIEATHHFNIDLRQRELFITGEDGLGDDEGNEPGVEFTMSARLMRNLRLLSREDKPILIHMKTNGGDWYEGMAMYDMIKTCPCQITILNYTHARSMSSIILQAADRRIMMPNSEFMFHQGTYAVSAELQTVVSNLNWYYKKSENLMLQIYVDAMTQSSHSSWYKKSPASAKKWLIDQMKDKTDVYMSAEDAVKAGFADSIFDGDWAKLTVF